MTFAIALCILILAALLCLVSVVQTLYLESLRLRARDLPALEFFKETLEESLGMKTERGVLAFSLVKHSMILLLGVLVLHTVAMTRAASWQTLLEAFLMALLIMLLCAYMVP